MGNEEGTPITLAVGLLKPPALPLKVCATAEAIATRG